MQPLILGPCLMESFELYRNTAAFLVEALKERDWYYKASFDKANRTKSDSTRGPGLAQGIEWFAEIKKEFPGIKLTTDVHETHQVEKLAGVIDCIQIPAFLCRQTDLLVEAGRHFNLVNVKKGQWLSPTQALHFVDKVRQHNSTTQVWLTERGTFFGYDRLAVDFSTVEIFNKHFDKVILDCSHSTQVGRDGYSGGNRGYAEKLMLTAAIFGYDGLFIEVHPNPEKAVSDADSQVNLERVPGLLKLLDNSVSLAVAAGEI